ncbi:hypothetical protein [Urbifossiella limnaea]|uniref:Uncharacterized protein n=1 Tax=Urbifossiella limnaea TaxID=2528023 RepID=A0A517XSP2_9BACT|nr:hypothetical protein [Urbifossiella limnaea]QDU20526.1 hypothetical protein ETAA1_24790 [Urbifossiella limnaea]
MRYLILVSLSALAVGIAGAADAPVPEWARGSTLTEPLSGPGSAANLVFSDPAVWSFGKDAAGAGFLELKYDTKKYKSSYSPKHRSPVHIALLKQPVGADFVLDVEAQSTIPAYGHQDLCLFFGFQSPEKYYYTHVARAADMNAHNVFVVNDAPRKNIATKTTKGVDWKAGTWHKLRLARQGSTGTVDVYFDDLTTPVITATDKTFQGGYVGIGSFDDTGRFRNLRVSQKGLTVGNAPAFFRPLGK